MTSAADLLCFSTGAFQRSEDAVLRVSLEGDVTVLNTAGEMFWDKLGEAGRVRLVDAAGECAREGRQIDVDLSTTGGAVTPDETDGSFWVLLCLPEHEAGSALVIARDKSESANLLFALMDSRQRYRDLVDSFAGMSWEVSPMGRFVFVNRPERIGRTQEELLHQKTEALLGTDHAIAFNPFTANNTVASMDLWITRPDGSSQCLAVSAGPVFDSRGNWLGTRGLCRDVTERRQDEVNVARSRNRDAVLTQLIRIFGDEVDPRTVIERVAANLPAALGVLGVRVLRKVDPEASETTQGYHAGQEVSADGYAVFAEKGDLPDGVLPLVADALSQNRGRVEMVFDTTEIAGTATDYRGDINGMLVVWRELGGAGWNAEEKILLLDIARQLGITFRQIANAENMERKSRTEGLTGLLNKVAFGEAVERQIVGLQRHNGVGALLFVDMNNFKSVNDVHGHKTGDEALLAVRDLLVRATRATDVLGRLGGDEFAMWLTGANREAAEQKAQALVDAARALAPYSGDDSKPLGISIGVAVWDAEHPEGLDEILNRADMAMYEAKRAGLSGYAVAESEPSAAVGGETKGSGR